MAEPETQSDWYTATNPNGLLDAARPLEKVTDKRDAAREHRREVYERRLQLFGCACARTVWDMLATEARSAVLVRERYASGRASQTDLRAAALRPATLAFTAQHYARRSAESASGWVTGRARETPFWDALEAARSAAKGLASRAAGPAPFGGRPVPVEWESAYNATFAAARAHQAELVRDIFPPPDHAVRALRLERAWLTDTVMTLARHADETGEYGALPILADALQDAGCDNEFALDRCRCPSGVHCRGNWVVDLLLGRV